MLVSELIKELQKKLDEHGDHQVCHWDDWWEFMVTEVNFRAETPECPAHILLGQNYHGFGGMLKHYDS